MNPTMYIVLCDPLINPGEKMMVLPLFRRRNKGLERSDETKTIMLARGEMGYRFISSVCLR